MRKNGVNRRLSVIEGGICAPHGFRAGGYRCGIRTDAPDIAVVVADRRCSAAAAFTTAETCGAPIAVSKRHLRDGQARAILVNGGVANVFLPNGEKLADEACDRVGKTFGVIKEDVLIASTGEIGKDLFIEDFEKGIKELPNYIGDTQEHGALVAQVMSCQEGEAEQLSFSFELGDFTCKIGVLYKGGTHICPNMATTLVFMTTDVNISSEMLQKALLAQIRETLNQIDVDGVSSPNDSAFVLANGLAGNCRIDRMDSEYKKFANALGLTLTEVAKAIAAGKNGCAFCCEIVGARSKQIARETAKKIVGVRAVKEAFSRNEADVEGITYALTETCANLQFSDIKIALRGKGQRLILFEDGKKISVQPAIIKEMLSSALIVLEIDLGDGNYRGTAYGSID